jgi:putative transferase (TIGR04331 family)
MRRLFLSRVESDFDPSRDIAAGPWCFIDDESAVSGWEELPFTDPIPDSQSLKIADIKTRRLANHIALSWADRMNTETGSEYSPTFWRNFLILWMIAAIQTSWRNFLNLELLIAKYNSEPIRVCVSNEEPNWQIRDLSDFMNLLQLDGHFNFWMSSSLLRAIAPDNWILEPVDYETSFSQERRIVREEQVENEDRSRLKAAIGRLGFDHVQGTKYSRLIYALLINLLPGRPPNGRKNEADNDIVSEFPETYLNSLNYFLEETLPTTFTSGFSAIEKSVTKHHYSPGRLTITHAASSDTKYQLINAIAVERGQRIVGFQHGGWYGTALAESWAGESEYIYHSFITWGWTAQEDYYGNMLPLPSPLLSAVRNKHHCQNNSLMLVGTKMIVQNDRFDSRPSSKRWLGYRRAKLDFINGISKNVRESLTYRPYHRSYPPLEDGAFITKKFPDIPIFEGSLNDEMLHCRLLVLDHPGSTLNLAMAANVPTICYWNPKDWPFSRQAEPLFKLLQENGLLFDNPVAAAQHINIIWDDVEGWWNRKNVKDARQEWADNLAKTSPFWWWHWAVAVWKLARGDDPTRIGREY